MAKATLFTEERIDQYTREGYWGPMTLSDYWERNAQGYPQREAIADPRIRLTWAQANSWIDRLALGFLERGLERDQTVVIQLPNCVELALLRVACERAGLLHLPVLRNYRHTEMAHILQHTAAEAVVIPWKYRDFDYYHMIQELRPTLPHLKYIFIWGEEVPQGTISLAQMLQAPLEEKYPPTYLDRHRFPAREFSLIGLTSGTTGMPKLVETPICGRIWAGKEFVRRLGLTGQDILAALAPAAQGPNIPFYFAAPQVGARGVMLEHWSVEAALELMARERVTVPCVVPAQLAEIVRYAHLESYDWRSLRVVHCTGALLPYHLGLEIEEKLGCPVVQSYGSVDYGGIAGVCIDDPQHVRLLTVGQPLRGTEIRLVDDQGKEVSRGGIGAVVARGPDTVSGYYLDPQATGESWSQDGWFRTGDLGRRDEQGNLSLVGRATDMIIRGGQNIYPLEVENLLLTHPKVANAAIVGIPDPIMGERACACIVPKPGQQLTVEEMVSFLKSKRIAAYKFPERLILLDSLPYVGGGLKLDRKALRAEIIAHLPAGVTSFLT